MTPPISRRAAVKVACSAMVLVALRPARAAESAKLAPDEPAAKALGYVENAAVVDGKKYASYAKGQQCENCLQLQGVAGDKYRPCSLFPGKLVAVAGWCSGWAAEM